MYLNPDANPSLLVTHIVKLQLNKSLKIRFAVCDLVHYAGIGAMTWSPLACGIISGKYNNGIPPYSRASLKVTLNTLNSKFFYHYSSCHSIV